MSKSGGNWLPALGRFLLLMGVVCIALSATPLPLWAYAIWGGSFLFWIAAIFRRKAEGSRAPSIAAAGFALCTLAAAGWELSYQIPPRPIRGRFVRLLVIGDSLSAADFTEGGDPWPALLARQQPLPVVNRAFSGATAASAEKRLSPAEADRALVLVEIGGNDVLGPTLPAEFERDLDRLLQQVSRPDNRVVMLELPLPPFYNSFGEIQRRLARRYHAILIPKRYFAGVFAGTETTIDSLHLSPAGHRRMAGMISTFVLPSQSSSE